METRTDKLSISMTDSERKELMRAASQRKMKFATWARTALLAFARGKSPKKAVDTLEKVR